jgi:hypothetical protein
MLKMMEKLADRHIWDEILGLCPLHRHQFAYQPGTSTETALHHVITHTEEVVKNKEGALGAFLDTAGAFGSTSFDMRTNAAKRHGLGNTAAQQICSMLGSRKITAMLAGESLEGSVVVGSPQRDSLSPLLWKNSYKDRMRMAVIHWGMQMALLS